MASSHLMEKPLLLYHSVKALHYGGCDSGKMKQDPIHIGCSFCWKTRALIYLKLRGSLWRFRPLVAPQSCFLDLVRRHVDPIDQHEAETRQDLQQCASEGKEGNEWCD